MLWPFVYLRSFADIVLLLVKWTQHDVMFIENFGNFQVFCGMNGFLEIPDYEHRLQRINGRDFRFSLCGRFLSLEVFPANNILSIEYARMLIIYNCVVRAHTYEQLEQATFRKSLNCSTQCQNRQRVNQVLVKLFFSLSDKSIWYSEKLLSLFNSIKHLYSYSAQNLLFLFKAIFHSSHNFPRFIGDVKWNALKLCGVGEISF